MRKDREKERERERKKGAINIDIFRKIFPLFHTHTHTHTPSSLSLPLGEYPEDIEEEVDEVQVQMHCSQDVVLRRELGRE